MKTKHTSIIWLYLWFLKYSDHCLFKWRANFWSHRYPNDIQKFSEVSSGIFMVRQFDVDHCPQPMTFFFESLYCYSNNRIASWLIVPILTRIIVSFLIPIFFTFILLSSCEQKFKETSFFIQYLFELNNSVLISI